MTQTDHLIQSVQTSTLFDGILAELREARIPTPRIYTVTSFPKLETFLIVYDKFCAVLEVDYNNDTGYVALGRNDAPNLSSGLLELVDTRVLEDDISFDKGVYAFKALIEGHEPSFQREIPDIEDKDEIIAILLDTWKLGSEIEMSGGFH